MKKTALQIPNIEKLHEVTQDEEKIARHKLGEAFREDPIWSEIMKNDVEKFPFVFGVPVRYTLRYGKIFASYQVWSGQRPGKTT